MEGVAKEVRESLKTIAAAFVAVRNSTFLLTVFQKIKCLGNMLNYGPCDDGHGPVHGFSISTLPKLKLCKSTLDPRITLLHILVLEVASENPESAQQPFLELHKTLSAARSPLRELVESVGSFSRRALQTQVCAREVAKSVMDGNAACVGGSSSSSDAVCLEVMEPPSAPDGDAWSSLDAFAKHAAAEAAALEQELSSVRGEAAPLLAFFAEPISSRPEEVELKVQEVVLTLHQFLDAFHTCSQQLLSKPDLIALCSRAGDSFRPAPELDPEA